MSSLFESGSAQDFSSSSEVAAKASAAVSAAEGDAPEGAVNYDEPALVEVELDEVDYRLDSGRAGTALCISTRPSGTYSWTFRGEARWQANVLRCKAFDRTVLTRLTQALKELSASE